MADLTPDEMRFDLMTLRQSEAHLRARVVELEAERDASNELLAKFAKEVAVARSLAGSWWNDGFMYRWIKVIERHLGRVLFRG